MLNILDIALAYPERREKLSSLAGELSLSRDQMRMYDRFFGFDNFHCDPDEPLESLIAQASSEVLSRNPGHDRRLSVVAHCHTLLGTSVFSGRTSGILAPFEERGIEVFSATMNHCATGVTMLGVFDRLLGQRDTGLILIGEKAFHPNIRLIENTTIMGEAAAAILVGRDLGAFEIVDTYTLHAPRFWKNSGLRGENYLEGFDTEYLSLAQAGLNNAMAHFGCSYSDIRYVLPHNVNVPSWHQVAKAVGLPNEKLQLSTISRFGHCFGADPFINLQCAAGSGDLEPSDQVLLFSIGLGATASCALLRAT